MICDPDSDTLHRVGDAWGVEGRVRAYEDLLSVDLDAIVIATPAPMHASQSIAALRAGIHVLSEVPAAWSVDECEALVKAAEQAEGVYMLAENMCYFHYLMEWRSRIQAGEIGRVTYAEAEYVHDCRDRMAAGNWRAEMPPLYYCTHSLGPVLDIIGDRCVQAIGMTTGSQTSPEYGAHDLEVGLFRTAGDVTIKILCGFSVCRAPAFHWQVFYGTEGVIENGRPPSDSAKMYCAGDEEMKLIESDVSDPGMEGAVTSGHGMSESLLVEDFVQAARGEGPVSIDVYQAVEMTIPGICAHESALDGSRSVEIPNFRPG